MTSLITQPQVLAAAAADVADINSAIGAARAAAAGPTTGLVAAAGDEVSAMSAALFGAYGQEYQALLQQAAAFHEQFVAALSSAGNAYAGAEAAASNSLGTLGGDVQALMGGNAAPATTTVTGALATAAPMAPTGPVTTLVLGASGLPIPPQDYIVGIPPLYINQFFPAGINVGLPTPEGLYPLTGINNLTLDVSVSQGVTILNNAIQSAIASGSTTVNVFGYSQSSTISSVVMQMLNPSNTPGGSLLGPGVNLNFTLVGDPSNPNGGLLTRFPGLSLPSLGITFGTATPDNSFPTHIYSIEYDGFADFPQYPIDVLSDLNAVLGIQYVHGTYASINPNALPQGDTMIELPGSATLPGGTGATNYYMISQPNLPLLDPVRAIPIIGNPIADLAQPDLAVLVNLGYGSTAQGWSTGPANVPTPFGVIPPVSPIDVAGALAAGTQQGMSAFAGDISAGIAGIPSPNVSLPDMSSIGMSGVPSLLPAAPAPAAIDGFIQALQTANTTIVNGISGAAANAYAVLLPTADIANALATSLPSYDVNLFLDGVQQVISGDPVGGLVYAFGAPVAADAGLGTLAAGFEIDVLLNAV